MMKTFELWFLRKAAVLCLWFRREAMAVRYWRRILALDPGNDAEHAKVIASIAHAQAALGHPGEAVSLLHRSLEIDPAQPGNWFNLGYLLQQAGAEEDAVAAFAQALALDAKLDRAWYGQALSLIALGRVDEAESVIRRIAKFEPKVAQQLERETGIPSGVNLPF